MKNKLTFLIFTFTTLLFSTNVRAGNDLDSRWQSLIAFAKLSKPTLQKACPNFKEPVESWIKQHPAEVKAFLALVEIKKINPALLDLGLNPADFQTKIFENSFWMWYQKSGITLAELVQIAPNFPIPLANDFSKEYMAKYEAAIEDWLTLFPKEVNRFINEPRLAKQNRFYNKEKIEETGEEFKGLKVEKGVYPEAQYYESGNTKLDAARLAMYVKNWYFTFDKESYFARYEPSLLEDYKQKKAAADKEPNH